MNRFIHMCLFCLLIISCHKDEIETPKDSINVEAKTVTIENSGGTKTIQFSASGNWSVSVADNAASWCSVSKSSGVAGINTIDIEVSGNETNDERNAAITLVCGIAKETITITQKQKDALLVETNKVEVKEEGEDVLLTIRANVSYTYEIDERCVTWIHKSDSRTRGLSTSTISLKIDANEELFSREGKIFISAGGLLEEVTIYQEGATPMLVISQKEHVVSSTGEMIKIEVASNTEYEYSLPQVNWISEHQTRAVSSYTHYITIDENNNYDPREAEIIFRNRTTGDVEVVKILQMQKDAIIIAKNQYNLNGEENILDFTVNTNVEFETKISADWIQTYERSTTRALVEKQLSFHIEKNPTTEERTATISFVCGDIKQTVVIVQDGRSDKMKIVVSHAEAEFSAPEFQGSKVSGTVEWGDGSKSDITQSHVFTNSNKKTSTYETMGVNKFRINSLNSISSITIYYNEGKNGSAEDFNVESKDWD